MRVCRRRRLCRGSVAGASSRVRGADRLMPATAGGVTTGSGALNSSPPEMGAEEGRGAAVRMSSGFLSDHGRSGDGKSALEGCSVGVGGCRPSGGGFKASWYSGVLSLRLSGLVGDGVAPVNIDFGCVDMERPVCLCVGSKSQPARATLSVGGHTITTEERGRFQLGVQCRRGTAWVS